MTDQRRTPEYWSCDDDENKDPYNTIDEAVRDFVDRAKSRGEEIPPTVIVYGLAFPKLSEEQMRSEFEIWIDEVIREEIEHEDIPVERTDGLKHAIATLAAEFAKLRPTALEIVEAREVCVPQT